MDIINIIDIAPGCCIFGSRPSSGPRSWFWFFVELLSFSGAVFSQFLRGSRLLRLINRDYLWGCRAGCDFLPEIRIGLERLGRATEFLRRVKSVRKRKWYRPMLRQWLIWAHVRLVPCAIQGARTFRNIFHRDSTRCGNFRRIAGLIFIPNTPLHDGAVIVRNDKIVVSAYLPLTENTGISKEFERVTAQPLVYLKFRCLLPCGIRRNDGSLWPILNLPKI